MYKNLPWYLQTPIINGRAGEFGSASMIEDVYKRQVENKSEKLISAFLDFYKSAYVLNDFSFASIASENTKEDPFPPQLSLNSSISSLKPIFRQWKNTKYFIPFI